MRVGVLIATYRGERFVADQLRTVLGQTRMPDMVVVTDDGSDDRTVAICKDVSREAPCPVVLDPHEHMGLNASLNRGLRLLDADVIFLADQDDLWYPRKVERAIAFLEQRPNVLVTFHNGSLIGEFGEPLDGSIWSRAGLRRDAELALVAGDALPVVTRWNPATGAAMVLRQPFVDFALPIPDCVLHDAWFALLAAAQRRLQAQSELLISYRLHAENTLGLVAQTRRGRIRQRASRSGIRKTEAILFASAAKRLNGLADPDVISLLERRASFSDFRANLAVKFVPRMGSVARQAAAGSYGRFTKQPVQSIIFDVIGGEATLQPVRAAGGGVPRLRKRMRP